AQAAGADEEPPPAADHAGVHPLEVRPPEPLRLVVGVAHVVADGALLAADVARARHWAGCVARGRGRCNVRAGGTAAGGASALPLARRRPPPSPPARRARRVAATPLPPPVRAVSAPGCGGSARSWRYRGREGCARPLRRGRGSRGGRRSRPRASRRP